VNFSLSQAAATKDDNYHLLLYWSSYSSVASLTLLHYEQNLVLLGRIEVSNSLACGNFVLSCRGFKKQIMLNEAMKFSAPPNYATTVLMAFHFSKSQFNDFFVKFDGSTIIQLIHPLST
jgi:hypothetical protein